MRASRLRVLKLGGSLLEYDDLIPALRRWLARQPPRVNVVVPGGGRAADLVRELDQRHALGAEAAHFLAIRAMSFTAHLLVRLLSESILIANLAEIAAADADGRMLIVDAEPLLRPAAGPLGLDRLPHTWDVTSDSIAARVAEASGAAELVLLKSCWPVGCRTWREAAEQGYVDAYFPRAAAAIPSVRWVNLRAGDRGAEFQACNMAWPAARVDR